MSVRCKQLHTVNNKAQAVSWRSLIAYRFLFGHRATKDWIALLVMNHNCVPYEFVC
jgi:hypothetical protein